MRLRWWWASAVAPGLIVITSPDHRHRAYTWEGLAATITLIDTLTTGRDRNAEQRLARGEPRVTGGYQLTDGPARGLLNSAHVRVYVPLEIEVSLWTFSDNINKLEVMDIFEAMPILWKTEAVSSDRSVRNIFLYKSWLTHTDYVWKYLDCIVKVSIANS